VSNEVGCELCLDVNGELCCPWYGLPPHRHDFTRTGSFIGSTVVLDVPENENFELLNDGMAIYYCINPKCDCSQEKYKKTNQKEDNEGHKDGTI